MNKQRRQRVYYILLWLSLIASAAGLILYSLKQNINLFFTPTQALAHSSAGNYTFRLGGQVKAHSVVRDKTKLAVHFVLTDLTNEIPVHFSGILPDLFKEGTGAIAEGHWGEKGSFIATQILAKHDENYMPRGMYPQGQKSAKT